MKCVILQPSYIPWRGYFHQIYQADLFIFYDDVQYDKHGWRNRNRIKTDQGLKWLTIPVYSSGAVSDSIPINRIRINWDKQWNASHWTTLKQAYGKAPYFSQMKPLLEKFYGMTPEFLADFTIDLTIELARALGITHTCFLRSSELRDVTGNRTERLISILQKVGATEYLSGPSARNYLEEGRFSAAGISLQYITYDYPDYQQLYPPYEPAASILDLMFMTGPDALDHIIRQPSPSRLLPLEKNK